MEWVDVLKEAENLAAIHSPLIGTRSLDIIQVASARLVGATDFLTFDTRQATLAQRVGLTVKP